MQFDSQAALDGKKYDIPLVILKSTRKLYIHVLEHLEPSILGSIRSIEDHPKIHQRMQTYVSVIRITMKPSTS